MKWSWMWPFESNINIAFEAKIITVASKPEDENSQESFQPWRAFSTLYLRHHKLHICGQRKRKEKDELS